MWMRLFVFAGVEVVVGAGEGVDAVVVFAVGEASEFVQEGVGCGGRGRF